MIDRSRLLQRFLQYVSIDTTARDDSDTYPSSPGQWELGRVLVEQLQQMGCHDVRQDEHAIVHATIGSNAGDDLPCIVFNSHLDTSPETTGKDVRPQVIDAYSGGDIVLPGDTTKVIRMEENPELATMIGRTLITTDGTTLLGGDDKAGVAVIMELASQLTARPDIIHGPVRILFTCDEEIGRGVDHVDVPALGAAACYTLDGSGADTIDVETFSADMAIVTFRGVNIHPSIAKGRMVNAIRAAGYFLAHLPLDGLSPETTEGRHGFLHPYVMQGGVDRVELKVLLRDFDTDELEEKANLLRRLAIDASEEFPGGEIEVQIQRQYRNLGDDLRQQPRIVEFAELAHQRLGRTAKREIVRGGTDGSRFTELGLPTPNLSTGQHNPHSPLEWACLDEMVQAAEVLVELVQVWGAAGEA
ncbi:MAG: peptidase T [Pirellulaceae bacterium]|nr:peptidase T [Planctomycetales bacterium]